MRRHDLINKKTMTKTKIFKKHPQRAIPETFDLGRHLIRVMRRHDQTKIDIDNDHDSLRTPLRLVTIVNTPKE